MPPVKHIRYERSSGFQPERLKSGMSVIYCLLFRVGRTTAVRGSSASDSSESGAW